jgi:RimJ/RimL family protein N-acetyltransferase
VIVTERLCLRPVREGDLADVVKLGADDRVMAVFGGAASPEKSREWLERLIVHWQEHGFGRFFVEHAGTFVGVVGLSRTDFDAGIVPGIEIAWRLAYEHWGQGYATEAARAVVNDGLCRLGFQEIVGVTTPDNLRSRRVMERLGMIHSRSETFDHPLVPEGDPRRTHIVFRVSR